MNRAIAAASALLMLAAFAAATAAEAKEAQDKLMIINGNTGRVIYDDGRDDLFCVTRRYVVRYNYWGRPIHRRTMRCR